MNHNGDTYWKRGLAVGIILFFSLVNIYFIPSKGTVDAANFEEIFRDVRIKGAQFIPDCLQYTCPSNAVLTKFPPGHFLFFYFFSLAVPLQVLSDFMATKMLIFLFYMLTLITIIWFARTVSRHNMITIWLTSVFVSLLSLILNTQALAYTDVLTFPFLILGLGNMLKNRFGLSGLFFAMSCLIKWQPIILLPVLMTHILMTRQNLINSFLRFSAGLVVPAVLLYPLDYKIVEGLWFSLWNAISHQGTVALNVPWIIQQIPGRFTALNADGWPSPIIASIQLGIFAQFYGLILARLTQYRVDEKSASKLFLTSLLMTTGVYYLFAYGVHENHFIMGTVIAVLLYVVHPTSQNFVLLRVVDLVNVLNMFVFYGLFGTPMLPRSILGVDISVILALFISLAGAIYFLSWISPRALEKQKI